MLISNFINGRAAIEQANRHIMARYNALTEYDTVLK
jgi:hypothetical protein